MYPCYDFGLSRSRDDVINFVTIRFPNSKLSKILLRNNTKWTKLQNKISSEIRYFWTVKISNKCCYKMQFPQLPSTDLHPWINLKRDRINGQRCGVAGLFRTTSSAVGRTRTRQPRITRRHCTERQGRWGCIHTDTSTSTGIHCSRIRILRFFRFQKMTFYVFWNDLSKKT